MRFQGVRLSEAPKVQTGDGRFENVRADDISSTNPKETLKEASGHLKAPRKKKANKQSQKDLDATLANNGRRRGANEKHCIVNAVESLAKAHSGMNKQDVAIMLHARLNGTALDEASGVLNDMFQIGSVFGAGQYFNAQTYAVGQNGSVKCATCPREVDAVSSIAFSGEFGKCVRCGHPRCLHCVAEDIDLADAESQRNPKETSNIQLDKTSNIQLDSCLMCHETSA